MQKILSADARIVDGKIILHVTMEISPDVLLFPKIIEEGIQFTRQEKGTLELVQKELTNKEIADRLNISMSAAKKHVSKILAKTGSRNRKEVYGSSGAFHLGRVVQGSTPARS